MKNMKRIRMKKERGTCLMMSPPGSPPPVITFGLPFEPCSQHLAYKNRRGRQKPKKSQQKPAKAHTKIAADAKNLRKASKSQQKHIHKSPRTPKTPRKPREAWHLYGFSIYNTDLIHI